MADSQGEIRITIYYRRRRRRARIRRDADRVWALLEETQEPGGLIAEALFWHDRLADVISAVGELRTGQQEIKARLDALVLTGEAHMGKAAVRDERMKSLEEALDKAIDRFLY